MVPSSREGQEAAGRSATQAIKLVLDLKGLLYEERLRKLNLPSLYYRQACGDAIEAYTNTHDFYSVSEDLFYKIQAQ